MDLLLFAQAFASSGLVQVAVGLIVLGVILYLVESLIPLDSTIRQLIRVVVVLAAVLWLLRVFAVF